MVRAFVGALLALGLAPALAGCDDGDAKTPAPDRPRSGFERALEGVGAGVAPTGTGFGWVDVAAIASADGPAAATEAARALGPGGEDLFTQRTRLRRAVGIDPLAARSATSISASYVLGVRLDGVSGERLSALLRAAGARSRRIGPWTAYDLGEQAQAPTTGALSALEDLASRVAVGPAGVVVARTDAAREALLDEGDSPLSEPELAFAGDCLGEVAAARTLPGNFTHHMVASPDLIAIGQRPGPAREEVLCAIGDSEADADRQAAALEATFAAGAREPLTGERIAGLVSSARVDELTAGDLSAARATLELGPRARTGLVFGALVRGSLLPYVGAPEPIPDDR